MDRVHAAIRFRPLAGGQSGRDFFSKGHTMRWFRMYSELLDDPKISEMNDRTFKIFVFLLCLSCECEANGVVTMSKKDICWRLRIAPRHLEEALSHLFSVSILGNDNRGIHFINWDKRQFRSDCSTERVKRFRNVSVTVNETPPEQNRNRTETEQITTSARNRKQNGSMLFDFATRKWSGIEQADLEMWAEAYPAVNLQAQIAKAADWLVSNPKKKKKNYRRFLSNWFSSCQERGGDKGYIPTQTKPSYSKVPERRDGNRVTVDDGFGNPSTYIEGETEDYRPRNSFDDEE